MKVVINSCYGGFGLSYEATILYAKKKGFDLYAFTEQRDEQGNLKMEGGFVPYVPDSETSPLMIHYSTKPLKDGMYEEDSYYYEYDTKRDDPDLVAVVEELGEKANGHCARLTIVEIPDGTDFVVEEYDGNEHIAEAHRTWS